MLPVSLFKMRTRLKLLLTLSSLPLTLTELVIPEGETLSLTCDTSKTDYTSDQVSWRKDGRPYPGRSTWVSPTLNVLSVSALEPIDVGLYTCEGSEDGILSEILRETYVYVSSNSTLIVPLSPGENVVAVRAMRTAVIPCR